MPGPVPEITVTHSRRIELARKQSFTAGDIRDALIIVGAPVSLRKIHDLIAKEHLDAASAPGMQIRTMSREKLLEWINAQGFSPAPLQLKRILFAPESCSISDQPDVHTLHVEDTFSLGATLAGDQVSEIVVHPDFLPSSVTEIFDRLRQFRALIERRCTEKGHPVPTVRLVTKADLTPEPA